jgi:hypothetical protein
MILELLVEDTAHNLDEFHGEISTIGSRRTKVC